MEAIRILGRILRMDNRGATAIEYGLIIALIVVAMMAGLSKLGGGANGMWGNISSAANTYM